MQPLKFEATQWAILPTAYKMIRTPNGYRIDLTKSRATDSSRLYLGRDGKVYSEDVDLSWITFDTVADARCSLEVYLAKNYQHECVDCAHRLPNGDQVECAKGHQTHCGRHICFSWLADTH